MIARPLWPITSESTDSILILASSKVFCTRCTWLAFSRTNCLRVRSSPRSSWIAGSGTKLARTSPCANNSDSHLASFTSVLRPGTFFTCAAFARTSSKPLSASTCHTGFQYTPVASIATCVQPFCSSHSPNSMRPAIVVANVRTKCDASLAAARRTHATTVSLCTSKPAQRRYITSMTASPVAPPAWGTFIENSIKRAPDHEGHWHIQGCSQYPRSNSLPGSQHHDDDRPLCRRTAQRSTRFIPKGPQGRCVTHSITSSARASFRREIKYPASLAALRLIAKSNLIGCSTGSSLG